MRFVALFIVWIAIGVLLVAPIAFLVGAVARTSCEDKGGQLVAAGSRMVFVGKVFVPAQAYRCEVRK